MPAGDTDDPALGFRQVEPLPKARPVSSQPADPGEPPAGTVIMSSGNDVRTLERNSFTALPGLGAIFSDGEGKPNGQDQQGGVPGSAKQLPERSPVNPLGKPGVKPAIVEPQRLEPQTATATCNCERREPERDHFPMLGGRKDDRLDLTIPCQTLPARTANDQHLPGAGGAQIRVLWFARMGGSEVVLEVVALKRSPARLVLPGEHQRAADQGQKADEQRECRRMPRPGAFVVWPRWRGDLGAHQDDLLHSASASLKSATTSRYLRSWAASTISFAFCGVSRPSRPIAQMRPTTVSCRARISARIACCAGDGRMPLRFSSTRSRHHSAGRLPVRSEANLRR